MSEERMQEIKDSINFQYELIVSKGIDKSALLFTDEEQELLEEVERLNNIINKAKIYCEDVIQEHENGEYYVDTVWLAIKEHKGNIKSVLNILNGDLENYWRSDKE